MHYIHIGGTSCNPPFFVNRATPTVEHERSSRPAASRPCFWSGMRRCLSRWSPLSNTSLTSGETKQIPPSPKATDAAMLWLVRSATLPLPSVIPF